MRLGVVSQRCEGGRGLANERGVCGGGLCETVGGLCEVKGIKGGSCGGVELIVLPGSKVVDPPHDYALIKSGTGRHVP